jgi:hypothetical protein
VDEREQFPALDLRSKVQNFVGKNICTKKLGCKSGIFSRKTFLRRRGFAPHQDNEVSFTFLSAIPYLLVLLSSV